MSYYEHFTFRVEHTSAGFIASEPNTSDDRVGRGETRAQAISNYADQFVQGDAND